MGKIGKWVSAKDAIKVIQPGQRIIVPIGCGLPTQLIDTMIEDKERLNGIEIVGGLQFEYKFLSKELKNLWL